MLLSKEELELAKLCGEDGRWSLNRLGVDKANTIVTNGHYLVCVPHSELSVDTFPVIDGLKHATIDGDTCQLISKEAALSASKALPKKATNPVLNTSAMGQDGKLYVTDLNSTSSFDAKTEGTFPNYKAVMPTGKPVVTIGLSAEYVKLLADYIYKNGFGEKPVIELSIYSPEKAVKMESRTDDGRTITAVLMPVRLDLARKPDSPKAEPKPLPAQKASPAPSQADSTPSKAMASAVDVIKAVGTASTDERFCWLLAAPGSSFCRDRFMADVRKYEEAAKALMAPPVQVYGDTSRVQAKRAARVSLAADPNDTWNVIKDPGEAKRTGKADAVAF